MDKAKTNGELKQDKQTEETASHAADAKETEGTEETPLRQGYAGQAEGTKEIKDKKIEELETQVKELENKWKRALADYQNQEKRIREQRSEWVQEANKGLLLRILPIFDTLMLAQQHSQDQTLKVSVDQFLAILKDEGVVKIDTVGKEFDPNTMEAIMTENGEDGKVIKEIRAGYMLHDKVLRAAQVTVGSGE